MSEQCPQCKVIEDRWRESGEWLKAQGIHAPDYDVDLFAGIRAIVADLKKAEAAATADTRPSPCHKCGCVEPQVFNVCPECYGEFMDADEELDAFQKGSRSDDAAAAEFDNLQLVVELEELRAELESLRGRK
jgi:Zn-finger nucleic acid-binding protein